MTPARADSPVRLFRTYKDGQYLPSTLWHVLQKGRKLALTPAQVASPLASRPYDVRIMTVMENSP